MATLATAAAPTTRLRITNRGRRVLAGLAAFPVAAAVAVATISGGSAMATRDPGAPVGAFAEITVMSGESLWSIAQDVAPTADPRDVVDEIAQLNGLEGVGVSAGQRLAIPVAYSAAL